MIPAYSDDPGGVYKSGKWVALMPSDDGEIKVAKPFSETILSIASGSSILKYGGMYIFDLCPTRRPAVDINVV
jgi:hypothetical protein